MPGFTGFVALCPRRDPKTIERISLLLFVSVTGPCTRWLAIDDRSLSGKCLGRWIVADPRTLMSGIFVVDDRVKSEFGMLGDAKLRLEDLEWWVRGKLKSGGSSFHADPAVRSVALGSRVTSIKIRRSYVFSVLSLVLCLVTGFGWIQFS